MFIPYSELSALRYAHLLPSPQTVGHPYHSWHSETLMGPLFGISRARLSSAVTVCHFQGKPEAVSLAALIRPILGKTGLAPEGLPRFSSSQWAGLGLPHFRQPSLLLTEGFSGHQTLILGTNTLFRRKASLTR